MTPRSFQHFSSDKTAASERVPSRCAGSSELNHESATKCQQASRARRTHLCEKLKSPTPALLSVVGENEHVWMLKLKIVIRKVCYDHRCLGRRCSPCLSQRIIDSGLSGCTSPGLMLPNTFG